MYPFLTKRSTEGEYVGYRQILNIADAYSAEISNLIDIISATNRHIIYESLPTIIHHSDEKF
jgi:hypothetical protein